MEKAIAILGTPGAGVKTVILYICDRFGFKAHPISLFEQQVPLPEEKTVVINRITKPEQIELIKSQVPLTIIALDATAAIRFHRLELDPKAELTATIQNFVNKELQENSPPAPDRLFECMSQADILIQNNGSLAELYAKVDDFLSQQGFI